MSLSRETIESYLNTLKSLKHSKIKTQKTIFLISKFDHVLKNQIKSFNRTSNLKPYTSPATEYKRLSTWLTDELEEN